MDEMVEQLRQSREYKLTKARLIDRQWRLDHLFQIKDENSEVCIFKRKRAQLL